MTSLLLLLLGLVGLWRGTLWAVRGAVELSERYGISQGFVGLAILAIGTDLPELVVAVSASIEQIRGTEASGMIVGSALGSVVAQGTLVLGVAGLFGYLPVARRMVKRDGTTLLLGVVLAAAVAADGLITRGEGLVLFLVYGVYFVALWQAEWSGEAAEEDTLAAAPFSASRSIVLGVAVVLVSAHFVVTGGVALAESLGVSQTLLAVILVGLGTSLPELALSIRAATERRAALSVGNVIGSNIFDLLVPIGVGAMLHPLLVERTTVSFDLPALSVATVLLLVLLLRRRGLQRWEAVVLLGFYLAYAGIRVGLG
ncbi:MAG: sodium:calcium antiporter [Gemmatimonadetes bacterium]|nr:sodium:calcium antiporter [Gemmatimonadota bacterium]NNK61581.1 sodium:calcium antiporter [Gemmatimonadota bacterium]